MLVLIKSCQDTPCTAVCCVWGCRAADQSGCLRRNIHCRKWQQWAHEHRDWTMVRALRPGLMNHTFFYFTGWLGVCVSHTWGTPGTMGRRQAGGGSVILHGFGIFQQDNASCYETKKTNSIQLRKSNTWRLYLAT